MRAGGPSGLTRRRGRASNRKYGEAFRGTVLALIRERYQDFGPTSATCSGNGRRFRADLPAWISRKPGFGRDHIPVNVSPPRRA
jgi:hypothetical protein